jgi:hypothetical protein
MSARRNVRRRLHLRSNVLVMLHMRLRQVRTGMVKLLIELGQLDEAEEFARGLLVVDDQ